MKTSKQTNSASSSLKPKLFLRAVFNIECRKTKTKAITLANYNSHKKKNQSELMINK